MTFLSMSLGFLVDGEGLDLPAILTIAALLLGLAKLTWMAVRAGRDRRHRRTPLPVGMRYVSSFPVREVPDRITRSRADLAMQEAPREAQGDEGVSLTEQALLQMDWAVLEKLVCALLQVRSLRAARTGEGGEDAVGITATSLDGARYIVRCIAGPGPVGMQPLSELYVALRSREADRAMVWAASDFDAEALEFAEEHGLELVDGPGIVRRLLAVRSEVRRKIWGAATSGDWTTPTCPQCGEKLVRSDGGPGADWVCGHAHGCAVHAGHGR